MPFSSGILVRLLAIDVHPLCKVWTFRCGSRLHKPQNDILDASHGFYLAQHTSLRRGAHFALHKCGQVLHLLRQGRHRVRDGRRRRRGGRYSRRGLHRRLYGAFQLHHLLDLFGGKTHLTKSDNVIDFHKTNSFHIVQLSIPTCGILPHVDMGKRAINTDTAARAKISFCNRGYLGWGLGADGSALLVVVSYPDIRRASVQMLRLVRAAGQRAVIARRPKCTVDMDGFTVAVPADAF
nr:MAG TPA: protein of unknown function (DUF4618) [Caudoviricetes sp.]